MNNHKILNNFSFLTYTFHDERVTDEMMLYTVEYCNEYDIEILDVERHVSHGDEYTSITIVIKVKGMYDMTEAKEYARARYVGVRAVRE